MQYDVAMLMFGGVGDTSDKSTEFDKIKKSFIKDAQTDKNAMYKIINTTVFPVVGPIKNLEITTKAFYDKNDEELIKLVFCLIQTAYNKCAILNVWDVKYYQ